MKNNFDWISESKSKVHNVQTLINGLKSQAMHKYDGECKILTEAEIVLFCWKRGVSPAVLNSKNYVKPVLQAPTPQIS